MITEVISIESLSQIASELAINKTNKFTLIADDSVASAIFYGMSKIGQKALKDIAIIEGHIFPDIAYGSYLDKAAELFGVPARLGASGSSTYIRVIADAGTSYQAGVHVFKGSNGISFDVETTKVVGSLGVDYIKVRSQETGIKTNVDANSIIFINPIPDGHTACVNEYMATGGRDSENDADFRIRIKQHDNIVAKGTIAGLTQIAIGFNSDILKLDHNGLSESGKVQLAVVTQNGINLSTSEKDDLLINMAPYFNLTDVTKYGEVIGIEFIDPTWFEVDLDFRLDIYNNYNPDNVRKDIQIALAKYLDFRYWDYTKKIEWDDLLQLIKNVNGVKYVPDTYFSPNQDMKVPVNQYPRIKGFIMRNLDGAIIADSGGVITPVFYPNGF